MFGKHWTPEELTFLRTQKALGLQAKEIAKTLGRSVYAVHSKASELKCRRVPSTVPHQISFRVTLEEKKELEDDARKRKLTLSTYLRRLIFGDPL